MDPYPHLSKPPVIEALLNFQANAAAQWGRDGVMEKARALFPQHTTVQAMQQFSVQIGPGKSEPMRKITASPAHGYMLRAPGQPTVHQVRRDGYAFSRLKPYENWEAFSAGALAGWEVYQSAFMPEELHSIAVRFINRLEFPATEFRQDRGKYLTIAPQVPPGLDWSFINPFENFAYAVPDSTFVVNVNLVRLVEPGVTDISAMTLDIEVAMRESLPAIGKSFDDVLLEMRRLKNDAFFHILTPPAIKPYF